MTKTDPNSNEDQPLPVRGDSLKQPFAHDRARPSTQAPRAFG